MTRIGVAIVVGALAAACGAAKPRNVARTEPSSQTEPPARKDHCIARGATIEHVFLTADGVGFCTSAKTTTIVDTTTGAVHRYDPPWCDLDH